MRDTQITLSISVLPLFVPLVFFVVKNVDSVVLSDPRSTRNVIGTRSAFIGQPPGRVRTPRAEHIKDLEHKRDNSRESHETSAFR